MECSRRGCSITALHFTIVHWEFKLKCRHAYRRHRHHHHHNLFYLLHPLAVCAHSTNFTCVAYIILRGESCPATTSSDRARQSAHSTDQLSADDLQRRTHTQKRARALKSAVSSAADHYSRRPYSLQKTWYAIASVRGHSATWVPGWSLDSRAHARHGPRHAKNLVRFQQ